MGYIWNKLLKPLLKGVAKVLAATVKWSFTNPIAAIGIGLGLLVVQAWFKDMPFLQGTFSFIGATMISSGVTGAIWEGVKDAGVGVLQLMTNPEPAIRAMSNPFWAEADIATELGF